MKILLAVLLFISIRGLPPSVERVDIVKDYLIDCDIEVDHIESIHLYSSNQPPLILDTEDGIEDVLDTEVIGVLEVNEDGTYNTPPETYLIVYGIVQIEFLHEVDYPSFGVVWNEESDRYWMLIFKNNAAIIDDYGVEAVFCVMVEIVLD